MSDFFVYISTKSTTDPFIPRRTSSIDHLSQDVSDGFFALSGGYYQVGKLALFPIQRTVPNHLLCDGREVEKSAFPELYAYLGASQGVAADPNRFLLPNYGTAFTPAVAPATETAVDGTVTTPDPVSPPPTSYPEQTDRPWGQADSGGRRNPDEVIP